MRRGRPRFAPGQAFIPAPGAPQEPVDPPPPARPRLSPAATLVAGVATLLLAMGVGVLIGNSGRTSAEGPQVITVGGAVGGSTVASGGTAAATTPQTPVSNTKKRAHKTTKEDLKAASKAATKVLGTAAPKKPIVKVGDKCSRGTAGCKDGKFEGNFFGP
jgi:hypothetical protein